MIIRNVASASTGANQAFPLPRRWAGIVVFVTASLASTAVAPAQPAKRSGLEPVGLLAFAPADLGQTSEVFKSCPANRGCEIAFLAYSFTHSTSFTNAQTLIQSVLPAYTKGQVLVVSIYLDDGANRDNTHSWCYFHPEWTPAQFWTAVRDGSMQSDWINNMAKPAGNWIRSMKAWADSKGWRGHIRFVVVPVLEDGGPTASDQPPGWAYVRLRDWTADGVADADVTYRRSSTTANADRLPGVPMEFHTAKLTGSMLAGDMVTGDGVNGWNGPSVSDWKTLQASAHGHGLSALWWVGAFNSNTSARTVAPWQRGPLKPFTNNPSLLSQAKALMVAP